MTSRPTGHDPRRTPRLDGTVVAVLPGGLAVVRTPAGEFVLRTAGAMPRDLRAGDLVSLQLTNDGAAAAVSLHPLVHAADVQAAARPAGSDFRLPPSSFAAMDVDEAIRPPPQPFREASETVDRTVRQRRLAAARITRCMNALRLLAPDVASRLLAVAPRADEQFGQSLALAVATSQNGGVRSLMASASARPEKLRGEVEAALDALDALFAPTAVDVRGAGHWMMRRVPLLRDGIVDTVIWAVQEETDVGIVRFAIDLGPGLFGASQIQCVAAGYMLDIRIVTEQAPPAEAEREISAAVISLAREVGLVATLRCVVGERDLLDFEGGTRLDFTA